jgi:hypothetical protein
MRELMEHGRNVHYITLTAHLGENGVNQCGGVAYVTSLTDGLPRVKKLYSPVILSGAGATATAQSKLSALRASESAVEIPSEAEGAGVLLFIVSDLTRKTSGHLRRLWYPASVSRPYATWVL